MPRLTVNLDTPDYRRLVDRARQQDRDVRVEARRLLRRALDATRADAAPALVEEEGRDHD